MKPLLLGEAPSKAGDRYHMVPLSGNPAELICRLMGWSYDGAAYWTLTEHFDTLNTIERYADAYPWSTVRARERWAAWRAEHPGDLVVVALGRKAANAIGVKGTEWGEWDGGPDGHGYLQRVAAPHTSGRSRIMNSPAIRGLLTETLRSALDLAKETA